ncbi:MAG: beta strand repeat-containing protein, partial [Steroidobacteraceae bacterium]
VDTRARKGSTGTWLLDPTTITISSTSPDTSVPANGTVGVGDPDTTGGGDTIAPSTITTALATTDVTLEASSQITVSTNGILDYNSSHALSLLSQGTIQIGASIQNAGTGDITVVGGWDGTTVGTGAQIVAAGGYGAEGGSVSIDAGRTSSTAVGSASGTTTVLGDSLFIGSDAAQYAQLGWHGVGGGDIVVRATVSGISLDTSSATTATAYAMLGNGSLAGDVTGDVTGNIDVRMGGTLDLFSGDANAPAWIGNATSGAGRETGNVVLIASNSNGGGNLDLGVNIAADLQGGDFTLGTTDTAPDAQLDGFEYNSSHTFNVLSVRNLVVAGNVQNDGTGAINAVAGWDGTTTDATQFGNLGVFGNNNGNVIIGNQDFGPPGEMDASLGSHGGTVSVFAANLDLDAMNGVAQLGYRGAGGGDIDVVTTGDITIDANYADPDYYALIGNGDLFNATAGAVTGNISLSAAGTLVFEAEATVSCDCSPPPYPVPSVPAVGNYSADSATSGNLTIFAAAIDDSDLPFALESSISSVLGGGNVVVGTTGPGSTLSIDSPILAQSDNSLTLLAAGNIDVTASIENGGNGPITLVGGWSGDTDLADLNTVGFYGNSGPGAPTAVTIGGPGSLQNVAVGSSGGLLSIYAENIDVAATTVSAQIGYDDISDTGATVGGDIKIRATGDLDVQGGSVATAIGQIGNGATDGSAPANITGNIDIDVAGQTTLDSANAGRSWIGNVAGTDALGHLHTETGDVQLITGQLGSEVGPMAAADLAGGNVTLGFTAPVSDLALLDSGNIIDYSSANTLTILSTQDLEIATNIQNSGAGNIDLVAGWDGTTLNPAQFANTGVY